MHLNRHSLQPPMFSCPCKNKRQGLRTLQSLQHQLWKHSHILRRKQGCHPVPSTYNTHAESSQDKRTVVPTEALRLQSRHADKANNQSCSQSEKQLCREKPALALTLAACPIFYLPNCLVLSPRRMRWHWVYISAASSTGSVSASYAMVLDMNDVLIVCHGNEVPSQHLPSLEPPPPRAV